METDHYIVLFFITLWELKPVLLLAVLAVTVSIMLLVSLYQALKGFVTDELEIWYINRRAKDVVEDAKEIIEKRRVHA